MFCFWRFVLLFWMAHVALFLCMPCDCENWALEKQYFSQYLLTWRLKVFLGLFWGCIFPEAVCLLFLITNFPICTCTFKFPKSLTPASFWGLGCSILFSSSNSLECTVFLQFLHATLPTTTFCSFQPEIQPIFWALSQVRQKPVHQASHRQTTMLQTNSALSSQPKGKKWDWATSSQPCHAKQEGGKDE